MAANNSNQRPAPQNSTPDMTAAQTNGNISTTHLSDIDYGITTPAAADETVPTCSGNGENAQNNDYGISLPIAPEGGIPAYPGNDSNNNDYGISLPIAPEGGIPAYPGNTTPTFPTFPVFPSFPSCPSCPSPANYGQVRFLNAATNNYTINITVDNTSYASNVGFGTITNYSRISDGFHTITVRRSTGMRAVLLQQTFPFSANEKYTMVLVDSAQGGLNMVQVASTSCNTLNANTGCYRVANMAYSGSSFDVMLYSHDAVFRNIGFQEVTAYKQAMAGSYQFYITNSSNFTVIRELPVLVIGAVTTGSFSNEPLVSYQIDICARSKYTSYLIGNSWSNNNLRVLTVED